MAPGLLPRCAQCIKNHRIPCNMLRKLIMRRADGSNTSASKPGSYELAEVPERIEGRIALVAVATRGAGRGIAIATGRGRCDCLLHVRSSTGTARYTRWTSNCRRNS